MKAARAELHAAAVERKTAREALEETETEMICAMLEMRAVLPKRLRDLCGRWDQADAAYDAADERCDKRTKVAMAAEDEYEKARTS